MRGASTQLQPGWHPAPGNGNEYSYRTGEEWTLRAPRFVLPVPSCVKRLEYWWVVPVGFVGYLSALVAVPLLSASGEPRLALLPIAVLLLGWLTATATFHAWLTEVRGASHRRTQVLTGLFALSTFFLPILGAFGWPLVHRLAEKHAL